MAWARAYALVRTVRHAGGQQRRRLLASTVAQLEPGKDVSRLPGEAELSGLASTAFGDTAPQRAQYVACAAASFTTMGVSLCTVVNDDEANPNPADYTCHPSNHCY
jgi:hypothetical protein